MVASGWREETQTCLVAEAGGVDWLRRKIDGIS